ncbi:MAG: aldehyde dehydrogenase family protein [Robiginitomaculum sp.]|nr:MAG: aldehyde dehydrogenase family protein [Robiginitomaculum sp.]
MQTLDKFYIDGKWVAAGGERTIDVINPANEQACAQLSLGGPKDVDAAVRAAQTAFTSFSQTSREERLELLGKVIEQYQVRMGDIAAAISTEMGSPKWLAGSAQAASGLGHLMTGMKALESYVFEEQRGTTYISKEAVGVCGFITPWNWPMNQIACKLAPALATGCTIVWKPSEISPLSANILMEVLDKAGVPAGVVNMVHGDGPGVGAAIAAHPGIDMVSFTGSTRAGVLVAQAAAPTVKRVAQELGGKSANIILDDLNEEEFAKAVSGGMQSMVVNSGQSCNAPSRMLVPATRMDEAMQIAVATANAVQVADPQSDGMAMGPVVSEVQYNRIQSLIETGIGEATLAAGGLGRPDGLSKGYYVRPTVFGNVTNDMTIAREEIFGPVLCILGYKDEDDAVAIANDTVYGLSGYISGKDTDRIQAVAARLRTGMVHVNGAPTDFAAPFGGYKQSGNGREWSVEGFEEFLETKAVMGVTKL